MMNLFRSDVTQIQLSQLHENPVQPQDRVTSTAVKSLTQNILESRFIAPIAVAKTKRGYTILDGHRRFAVAVALGLEHIDGIILPTTQATPELWFIWLNGGIRNVTGSNWFYVWAKSEEPDETLKHLPPQQRLNINEMVAIYGQDRAIEIASNNLATPHLAKFVRVLVNVLIQYELMTASRAQQRRVGEWVLEHRQTNTIRQDLQNTPVTKAKAARFHRAIQSDRPVRQARSRATRTRATAKEAE